MSVKHASLPKRLPLQTRDKGPELTRLTRSLRTEGLKDDGTFTGYGSVFDVLDSYREIVARGAFTESLERRVANDDPVRLLWQHRWDSPIGVYTSIVEDQKGLLMEGQLALDVQQGKEAFILLKMKALKGLSIGFVPEKWQDDKKSDVRTLEKVDLWETSLVTFPANTAATVTQVRTVRDFEQFLTRDAGFTRSEARVIINQGYKALESMRGAGDEDVTLCVNALKRNLSILKTGG